MASTTYPPTHAYWPCAPAANRTLALHHLHVLSEDGVLGEKSGLFCCSVRAGEHAQAVRIPRLRLCSHARACSSSAQQAGPRHACTRPAIAEKCVSTDGARRTHPRQCLQPQKRRTPTIGTPQPRVASSSNRLQHHHRRWPGGVIRPDRCNRLCRHLNVVPTHFVRDNACIVHEAFKSPRY